MFLKKNGSAIAYGLVVIAVVSILMVSAMQFVVSNIKYNSYIEEKEKAFHIAESGIYFYRWYLAHQIEGKNQDEINVLWQAGSLLGVNNPPYVKDYLDNNQNKIGEAAITITFPVANNYNIVNINSTGYTTQKPDIQRTIRATLRRSLWSDFAVISDEIVCFDPYWIINGKVLGNSGVHFDGRADNLVMAGVSSYTDNNSLHNTVYNNKPGVWATDGSLEVAGARYPVAKKDFTGVTSHLQTMRTKSREPNGTIINGCGSGGCFFDNSGEGRRIILDEDSFDICTVDSYWDNNGTNHHYPRRYKRNSGVGTCVNCEGLCAQSFTIPDNGVIFVDDNIWLSGTIEDRRTSIAAASISDLNNNANIFVVDNISYTNYDGSDILGIIAEGDFEILKNTPNALKIDGALLAQNGAVTKPEYNPQCCGSGCTDNKNYLDILGSVITKGGLQFSYHKVGCPDLDEQRTITYDSNLLIYPPPFFPADSFYYVDFWKEI